MRERTYVAVLLILAAVGIFLSITESARNPAYGERPLVQYALAGLFGLALGFVVQRSRFCFTSAIRDSVMFGVYRNLKIGLLALAVATLVYSIYFSTGIDIDPMKGGIPTTWHPLVGGILFGFGMVIAGGCVMSTLYRIGEGNIQYAVVLASLLAGIAVAVHTFWWWFGLGIGRAEFTTIAGLPVLIRLDELFKVSPVVVGVVQAGIFLLAYFSLEKKEAG